ncbi:uncharacterized protein LOC121835975 [Ixodes scapularis]|uniref:uncharacterized protein LOC121835975 n=1 Tax=Ixodes scapularis TaxID=6945 RepID=UPI001C3943CF|nr:uncharacterized protein LOC121835975 [Ixodes scapularis]
MAAKFAYATKAAFLLVLCLAVACNAKLRDSAQHTCAYPQACNNPGNPDPGHTVTTTARYNPGTGRCVTTPSVTGPHDCQRFATLADCQRDCGQ